MDDKLKVFLLLARETLVSFFLMFEKLNIFISLAAWAPVLFFQWPSSFIFLFPCPWRSPYYFSMANKLYIFISFGRGGPSYFFQWLTSFLFLFHGLSPPLSHFLMSKKLYIFTSFAAETPTLFLQWPTSLIFLLYWPGRACIIFSMANMLYILFRLPRALSFFDCWQDWYLYIIGCGSSLLIFLDGQQALYFYFLDLSSLFKIINRLYISIPSAVGLPPPFLCLTSFIFLFHWPQRPPSYFFQWPTSFIFLFHFPQGPQSLFLMTNKLYILFTWLWRPLCYFINGQQA